MAAAGAPGSRLHGANASAAAAAAAPVGTDPEITFLSGVDATNAVAGTTYGSWVEGGSANPATYSTTQSAATKWGSPTPGTAGGTVTYYFDPASNWTPTEQAGLVSGLTLWSDEVNIQFVQTTNAALANFTFIRGTDGKAYEASPNLTPGAIGSQALGSPGAGTFVAIDTSVPAFANIGGAFSSAGGSSYATLVQQEGHVLGLGRAGPYQDNYNAATQQFGPYDSRLWSQMSNIGPANPAAKYFASYPVKGAFWGGNQPTTPQTLDILAAQRLYGAATTGSLAAGNVVFGFNSNITDASARYFNFAINTAPVVTLWAGGANNTLDLSGFTQNSNINLNPDTFTSADGLIANIGIADGVNITTAIGGIGNDVFYINDSIVSTLTGGGGIDTFIGSLYGWAYSTITDLSLYDKITFTDAAANFTYQWKGDVLNFADSSGTYFMNLPNNPIGHLVTSVDPSGGVDLTLANQDPGLNDFNGDGKSDILWQDTAGSLVQWQMSGRAPTTTTLIGSDPAWTPLEQGRGDFNGDHQSDILYRNGTTGQVVEWDMNGATVASAGAIGGDLNWSVAGTGDFNGDGKTDILWRNTNGTLVERQMNDRATVSSAVLGLDPKWTVVGTGDFNGDGKTDILQRDSDTGQVVEWDMNGSTVTSAGFIGGSLAWSVVGTGDFNGDGKTDILWRNTNGTLAEWQMNDRTVIASAIIGLDPGWNVVGTGDFNGTGFSDILQRSAATGQVVEWDMHGSTVISAGVVGGDQNWHVATS